MREDSGQHGCDALILVSSNDAVSGGKTGVVTLKGYRASCAAYLRKKKKKHTEESAQARTLRPGR